MAREFAGEQETVMKLETDAVSENGFITNCQISISSVDLGASPKPAFICPAFVYFLPEVSRPLCGQLQFLWRRRSQFFSFNHGVIVVEVRSPERFNAPGLRILWQKRKIANPKLRGKVLSFKSI